MTGKAPVTLSEGMDAILKPETMAGSPDADAISQHPAVLRMVFCFGASVLS
jgi:hypothetical protein